VYISIYKLNSHIVYSKKVGVVNKDIWLFLWKSFSCVKRKLNVKSTHKREKKDVAFIGAQRFLLKGYGKDTFSYGACKSKRHKKRGFIHFKKPERRRGKD
jgi:hypothetical protein